LLRTITKYINAGYLQKGQKLSLSHNKTTIRHDTGNTILKILSILMQWSVLLKAAKVKLRRIFDRIVHDQKSVVQNSCIQELQCYKKTLCKACSFSFSARPTADFVTTSTT